MQESLKELLYQYALARKATSVEDFVDLKYNPTPRQRKIIDKNSKNVGFAKGWANAFASDKFGEATTHWRKLEDRVSRGIGSPCPLLLIGIPKEKVLP